MSGPVAKRDGTQGRVEVGASWPDNIRSRLAVMLRVTGPPRYCFVSPYVKLITYIHNHREDFTYISSSPLSLTKHQLLFTINGFPNRLIIKDLAKNTKDVLDTFAFLMLLNQKEMEEVAGR